MGDKVTWISVKDRLPTEPGPIEVLIGGTRFLGEAKIFEAGEAFIHSSDYIVFHLDHPRFKKMPTDTHKETWNSICKILNTMDKGTGWMLPSHLKDPTHWIPLPEPPKA